jgi:hypothetical protein
MFFGRIANRLGIIKKSFSRFVDCIVFLCRFEHQTKTKDMKTTRICKGLYQMEWNGHIIQISNEAEWVGVGSLTWAILSDTLDLDANEGMWDTLYSTKKEALERLPEILKTSKPY